MNTPRRTPARETPELDLDTESETDTETVRVADLMRMRPTPHLDRTPLLAPRDPGATSLAAPLDPAQTRAPLPERPVPPARPKRAERPPPALVASLAMASVALAVTGVFVAIAVVWAFVASGSSPTEERNPLKVIGLAIQERLEPAPPPAAPAPPVEPPRTVVIAPSPPMAPPPAPVVAAAPRPAPKATASSPRRAPPAPAPAVIEAPPLAIEEARIEEAELDSHMVLIRAEGKGVLVEIDGRAVGEAPARASVTPGKHQLRLISNGIASDMTIDVRRDPYQLCFDGKGRSIKPVPCS